MKAYCEAGCRDYQCGIGDVHVYSRHDGLSVHVAHARAIYPEPMPAVPAYDPDDPGYTSALGAYLKKVFALSRRAVHEPIGGDYDGAVLHAPTLAACVAVLDGLRQDGYQVPESLTDSMRAEMCA